MNRLFKMIKKTKQHKCVFMTAGRITNCIHNNEMQSL